MVSTRVKNQDKECSQLRPKAAVPQRLRQGHHQMVEAMLGCTGNSKPAWTTGKTVSTSVTQMRPGRHPDQGL